MQNTCVLAAEDAEKMWDALSGLTLNQIRVWRRMKEKTIHCAFDLQTSISTMRALVKKGFVKNVTKPGAGGMFSPRTHYQFMRIEIKDIIKK